MMTYPASHPKHCDADLADYPEVEPHEQPAKKVECCRERMNWSNDAEAKLDEQPRCCDADVLDDQPVKRFSTGAVRSTDCDAVRYDLISPIGIRRVAETCAEGAAKYGDFNWEKGMPVAEMLNHATAHIFKYLSGDRSEDHLGHAAWNLMAACHSEELWPDLNGMLRTKGCKPPTP